MDCLDRAGRASLSAGESISTANNNNEREIAARLVRRIVSGDRNAEDELCARYFRGVHRFLQSELRRLGVYNVDLAEDLAQDTFVTVLGQLRDPERSLADAAKLNGYIIGIARNLARAWRRKRNRQQTEPDLERIARVCAQHGDPLKHVEQGELATLVRGVLEELPVARDREILRRFYLVDEDKHIICKDLAIDDIHFNRVVYRARKRLRDLMESARVVVQ